MANSAANALRREIDEVITPMIDKYRLSKWCANAGAYLSQDISSALGTESNAYECFLDATAELTENKVPLEGRIAYVTPEYYKKSSWIQPSQERETRQMMLQQMDQLERLTTFT